MPLLVGDGRADGLTYAAAGVDIAAGERAVDLIRPLVASTDRPGVIGGIGGFGGLFAVPTDRYREPVLVAATDGVGTKLEVARAAGRFDTVGIDLVAMCVDDLVCQGAEPLFFLDYVRRRPPRPGPGRATSSPASPRLPPGGVRAARRGDGRAPRHHDARGASTSPGSRSASSSASRDPHGRARSRPATC